MPELTFLPSPPRMPAGMQGALVAELSAGLQPVWAAADTSGRRGAADAFAGARAVASPVGLIGRQPCPRAASHHLTGQCANYSAAQAAHLLLTASFADQLADAPAPVSCSPAAAAAVVGHAEPARWR